MLSKTNILFININGFNPYDLNTIKSLLDNNIYDLCILQETWFAQFKKWKYDPYLYETSIYPSTPPVVGHISGGIAIFGHPSMRHSYQSTITTSSSICFLFKSVPITTSYQPPSTSLQDIQDEFKRLPKSDILIGDFNYRIGRMNHDTGYTAAPRRNVLYAIAQSWNLSWCQPELNLNKLSSRTDHLFCCSNINASVNVRDPRDFKFITDHNVLDVQLVHKSISTCHQIRTLKHIAPKCYRLAIKHLKDPITTIELKTRYSITSEYLQLESSLNCLKDKVMDIRQTSKRESLSSILDEMNSMITDCLWEVSEQVLGSYNVSNIKARKDNLFNEIETSKSNCEAIMMFKRANRGYSSKFQPSSRNSNVLSEANDFFESIWNSNQSTGLEYSPPIITTTAISFDCDQIRRTIMRYPSTKSCGSDGIHVSILKALSTTDLINHLKILFNTCLTVGVTPRGWNEAVSVLIPKKTTDCPISDSRPISLTSMFRRIFEICLKDYMESIDSSLLNLHPCQAGGRKGYSTVSNVLILDEMSHHDMPYTVLLDIKKGFDSVRHPDLLSAIQSKCDDTLITSILFSLFMFDMRTSLIVNGHRNSPIAINKGIFQGSVLSPLLFNIWIDELVCKLNESTVTLPKALAFIDDLVLKSDSEIEIKSLLKTCEEWSITKGIQFNTKKCFVLKTQLNDPLMLYDEVLPIVDSAKYLGVPFTSTGAHVSDLLDSQLESTRSFLHFMNIKSRQWPEWIKLQLLKTFGLSKLTYCAPITGMWLHMSKRGSTLRKKMKEVDQLILQWIFNTNLLSGFNVMRSIIQIDKIEDILSESIHSFHFQKLKYLSSNPWFRTVDVCNSKSCHSSLMKRLNGRSQVINQYMTESNSMPTGQTLDFKMFMKKRRFKRLSSAPGILHHYILPRSRINTCGLDMTMLHRHNEERRRMLDWRRNLHFTRMMCPRCKVDFNRGHINDCQLVLDIQHDIINDNQVGIMLDDQHYLHNESMEKGFPYNGHYNILDALLNNQDYKEFMQIVTKINDHLSPTPNSQTSTNTTGQTSPNQSEDSTT